jgi:uncharacterized protein YecT (DUF1311 family)
MFPIRKINVALAGLLVIISGEVCHAQTLKNIADFKQQEQKCADEGTNMRGCAIDYYNQMDSILNLAYYNLRKKLPPSEIVALKNEEIKWLKKRNAYFRKLEKEEERESGMEKGDWRETEYLGVAIDEDNFVEERTIALIKRLNK